MAQRQSGQMRSSSTHDSVCVLAADDQPAFRAAVREVVAATDSMVVVGEAENGERAVELAAELRPDLVLLDVRMPGIGGSSGSGSGIAAGPSPTRPSTPELRFTRSG